jgi:hypothetical protein
MDEKIQYVYNFLRFTGCSYLIIIDPAETGDTSTVIYNAAEHLNKKCPLLPMKHTIGSYKSDAFFNHETNHLKIIVTVERMEPWLEKMSREWGATVVSFDSHI